MNWFSKKTVLHELNLVGNRVRLEASSKCQLKCPLCMTGTGETRTSEKPIGWGHLKFADFQQFILQNPKIREIELSNYGEIFLNPEILEIIQFAFEKKVNLSALNGVNLNHLKEEVAEGLVKYQFGKIKVSIDGASQETYKVYRVGGDFEKVIENIQKINFYKQKYRSKHPKLKWQFIIFGHNEHELPKARQMAESLGMTFKPKLNYKPKKYPINNPEFVKKESGLGVSSIQEYENQKQELYSPACMQLWTQPQINWDGKLLGCCVNHFGDFGNVFDSGLDHLLQSEKYQYAKQMVLGEKPERVDIPCTQCKRYQRVKKMPFQESLSQEIERLDS